ncbi:MAG: hypothetical protein LBT88_03575 [Oscillospiraceae bacterium]|nr:hypothetical protein [Oscillospiraceae bacterium]
MNGQTARPFAKRVLSAFIALTLVLRRGFCRERRRSPQTGITNSGLDLKRKSSTADQAATLSITEATRCIIPARTANLNQQSR